MVKSDASFSTEGLRLSTVFRPSWKKLRGGRGRRQAEVKGQRSKGGEVREGQAPTCTGREST